MAVDEAILESAGAGAQPPTLRIYSWTPPCLSLGYAQPAADVDWRAAAALAWQVVRRPTGGRAILHTDELTYSVAGPENEPRLAGGVLESYRRLAEALLDGLHRLSLAADAQEKSTAAGGLNTNPVCFETPSNYEITVNGKKLVGSAQSRRLGGVLQHGSLPLHGDLTRITQALCFAQPADRLAAARRLLDHATTVENVLYPPPDLPQAAAAIKQGFEHALDLRFEPGQLSPAELARADQLVADKYGSPTWTRRI
jgi:lipoate-protein ligase A